MKNVELNFYKSSNGNLMYKIFRFRNSNKDLSVEYFINNYPDLTVNESDESINIPIKNYQLFVNEEVENEVDFFSVSCAFDIVVNNTSIILNLKNDTLSNNVSKLRITFSNNIISKLEYMSKETVTKIITAPSEIIKLIKVQSKNTILLNKKEFLSLKCTVDLTAKVIKVTDYNTNGLYDPIISSIETKDYFLIFQDSKNFKNTYYYKAIAYDGINISEISNTNMIEVSEPINNISTTIECSENYSNSSDDIWNDISNSYNPSSEIKLYKAKNEMASNIVKNIYSHEIQADDRLLVTDGIRTLKISNVWHKDKREIMQRQKKVFRVKNILKENTSIQSEYSKVIEFKDKLEVLIDKMIILKKNVTGVESDIAALPISLTDIDASILKIYIRQGGIFYSDYINSNYETNLETPKDLISLITLDSRFPILSIKDSCVYSNKYNYTVYLYDEIGNISEPVSIVM